VRSAFRDTPGQGRGYLHMAYYTLLRYCVVEQAASERRCKVAPCHGVDDSRTACRRMQVTPAWFHVHIHGAWHDATRADEAASEGQTFRKRPSLIFMMLALCTAVTVFRLFNSAYSNAYWAVRLDFASVITCRVHSGC